VDDETRPGRLRRWLKRLAVVVLAVVGVLALVAWGGRIYLGRVGTEELARTTAKLDAEEPGWRLADLAARHRLKALPEERNSAPVVLKVNELLDRDWRERKGVESALVPVPKPLTPGGVEALSAARAPTAEARALARTLRDLPDGYYPLGEPADLRWAHWSHVSKLLAVSKLLRYDAALAVLDGDPDGAIAACHAALNVGRSVGDHPSLLAQLTCGACSGVAVGAIGDTLGRAEPTKGLAELQAAIVNEADVPRLLFSVLAQRAWLDAAFSQFESGAISADEFAARVYALGPERMTAGYRVALDYYRGIVPGDHAESLRVLTETIAALRLPPHERLAAFARIRRPPPAWSNLRYPLAAWYAQEWTRYGADQLDARARLLAAAAGIACERFRRREGRWPGSLDEIPPDILPAALLDPFDGRPLRLRPLPDGLGVCAVRPEGYGPGPEKPGEDRVVFRLWDPEHRRKPPAEPKAKDAPGPDDRGRP
jgi:hypothetical protein